LRILKKIYIYSEQMCEDAVAAALHTKNEKGKQ
jgi:hypothetical protein